MSSPDLEQVADLAWAFLANRRARLKLTADLENECMEAGWVTPSVTDFARREAVEIELYEEEDCLLDQLAAALGFPGEEDEA